MSGILVYAPSWNTMGGGEKYLCTVADTLASTSKTPVTLLTTDPATSKEGFRRYFNLELHNVLLCCVKRSEIGRCIASSDTAVVMSNVWPVGKRAPRMVYVIQIPYGRISPLTMLAKAGRGRIKEAAKDSLRRTLLREARSSDLVLVYSTFVKDVLLHHHGIDAEVLYPSIDDFHSRTRKHRIILSVGRFFRGLYNDKRFDVMIEAFKRLYRDQPDKAWRYRLVGSCAPDQPSRRYLDSLRRAATGFPIEFIVNAPYAELHRHYSEASLFWHAAGYRVDEEREPERTEHFGMSTVEAMSARCVPVVVRRGGQKEIVSDGESGYLWDTVDQLVEQSVRLMSNPVLLRRMRERARLRFHRFDRQHFSRRCLSLFHHLESKDHG